MSVPSVTRSSFITGSSNCQIATLYPHVTFALPSPSQLLRVPVFDIGVGVGGGGGGAGLASGLSDGKRRRLMS